MTLIDGHTHTRISCDSTATMEAYCEHALHSGIATVCFTEHVDFNRNDSGFRFFNEAAYASAIETVKGKYASRLKLLFGIEFGEPHLYPDELKKLTYPYDVVIGSVHWVGNDFVGDRKFRSESAARELYTRYYDEMLRLVSESSVDVVAHFDFPKRYTGIKIPVDDMTARILDVMVQRDIALEINSSLLRKGGTETLPGNHILTEYLQRGGTKVTTGSDAHAPEDLCAGFNVINTMLAAAGVTPGYFEQRRFVRPVKA